MAQYGTAPGIYNTGNFTQDLAVKDFASMILRYMPNGNAPLFALTAGMKKETATNTTHGYFSKSMIFPSIALTASLGGASTDTILTVSDTSEIIEGTILMMEATRENMLVTSITDNTHLVVTRGIGGGITAIDIVTQPVNGYKIGNAYEEGSMRPNALAITPVQITNLTQIFRNTYAITGTADAVAVIAGDATAAENQRDAAAMHATDLEYNILFGKKSIGTKNGQPIRFMDGVASIVGNINYYPASYSQPNVFTAASGGTDFTTLESYLDPTLNQVTDPTGPNTRVIFCGGTALKAFNQIAMLNGSYRISEGDNSFGLQFRTFVTTRGTFLLKEHPLLNTSAYFSKMAFVVDLNTFNLAYLGGRDTQDRKFNQKGDTVAQDNGIDATGGTLTTECTVMVKNPPANAVIYNLTAGLKNA